MRPRKGHHLAHVGVRHLGTCTARIIARLSGKAFVWTEPVQERPALLCVNYSLFTAEVMKVSDRPVSAREVTRLIWAVCQGARGVGNYAAVFHTLGAEDGWNEKSTRFN